MFLNRRIVRFLSDKSTTTLPPLFSKDKISKDKLDDSVIGDDARLTNADQVPWPSKSLRPPRRVQKKPPKPILDQDDSEKTILIFPGQGCQYVGMGQKAIEVAPSTRLLFDRASNLLGYDLYKMCQEGPKSTLDRTEYCQPAIMVSSLAAIEALWEMDENAVKNCVATAGFSVGELTALVFAGALTFEDGIRLVHARAKAMQMASDLTDSGMMTIFYSANAKVGLACEVARKWIKEQHAIEDPVCNIANHLYAGGKVLAGHVQALDFIEANKADFAIRKCKRLPVSGAFHTSLMLPAVTVFKEYLSSIETSDPRITVYSNVDNEVYRNASHVKKLLPKQINNAVKWESIVNNMFKYKEQGQWPRLIECGPGTSLSAMMKNINGQMAKRTSVVAA